MIALRKTVAAFGAELVSLGVAQAPGYGELAIEVAAAGICGSDIHAYEWTAGYEFIRSHAGHDRTRVLRGGAIRRGGGKRFSSRRSRHLLADKDLRQMSCLQRRAAAGLRPPQHHRSSLRRRLCGESHGAGFQLPPHS